jgi:beta-lactamase regulating signal transducer with metallopeptidase domain
MKMNDWLKFLLSISLSGAIMFGIWSVGRYVFRKTFTKRFHYFMLFMVLLRFILPVTSGNSLLEQLFLKIETTPVYTYVFGETENASADNLVIVGNPETVIIGDNVVIGSGKQSAIEVNSILFVIWVVGFLLLFIRRITKYQSFLKYVRSAWEPVDDSRIIDALSVICEERNIHQPIDVYVTPLIASPLLLGFWKSRIVLPHLNLTTDQLNSILIHEVTHYKKRDIWYKWFTQLVVCMHWFNPVVYLIEKVVNRECELACDEKAVKNLSKEQKKLYGLTLIEMTKHYGKYRENVASITLYENKNELKSRLEAMKTYRFPTRATKISGGIVFLIFLFVALKLGAYDLFM